MTLMTAESNKSGWTSSAKISIISKKRSNIWAGGPRKEATLSRSTPQKIPRNITSWPISMLPMIMSRKAMILMTIWKSRSQTWIFRRVEEIREQERKKKTRSMSTNLVLKKSKNLKKSNLNSKNKVYLKQFRLGGRRKVREERKDWNKNGKVKEDFIQGSSFNKRREIRFVERAEKSREKGGKVKEEEKRSDIKVRIEESLWKPWRYLIEILHEITIFNNHFVITTIRIALLPSTCSHVLHLTSIIDGWRVEVVKLRRKPQCWTRRRVHVGASGVLPGSTP